MKRGIIIGACCGLAVTLLAQVPLWLSFRDIWRPLEKSAVAGVLAAPGFLLSLPAVRLYEHFHRQHEHLGCRKLHIEEALRLTWLLNTLAGAGIGAMVVAIRNKRKSNITLNAIVAGAPKR